MIGEYIIKGAFVLGALYLIAYPLAMVYVAYHRAKEDGHEHEDAQELPKR